MRNYTIAFIGLLLFFTSHLYGKEKLLVILNNKAGQGKAEIVFEKEAKSKLLKKYDLEVLRVKGGKEAYKHLKSRNDLETLSGILGFGGDGTQNKILKAHYKKCMLSKTPLGVIPTGSGNALASSLFHQDKRKNEEYGVKSMITRVLSGKTRPLALWSYKTDLDKKGISALGFSFGLMADIDIDSEPFRFMGAARFDFVGFFKWIGLKSYPALMEVTTDRGRQVRIRGPFRQFFALNLTHLSEKVVVAPRAELNDGLLYLSYIKAKEANHCMMFEYLTKLDKEASSLSFVKNLKAKKIKFILKAENKVTVDGKLLNKATRSVTVKLLSEKAKIFAFDAH